MARKLVSVVGAGPAGLAAAERLLANDDSCDVVVLESAPRVGGRTGSTPLLTDPSVTIDVGGQWLGASHQAARKVAEEMGIPVNPQFCRGRRVIQMGADIRTYSGLIPNLGIGALVDAQLALWMVKILQLIMWYRCCCMRWAARTTMEQLMNCVMWTTAGRALLRVIVQAFLGHEPSEVSVLAFCM